MDSQAPKGDPHTDRRRILPAPKSRCGPDVIDSLDVLALHEEPERYERIILDLQQQAESDPDIAGFLKNDYLQKDREEAFNSFFESEVPETLTAILGVFGVTKSTSLCEVGAGSCYAPWALSKLGFTNLSVFEPNANFNTGTGYLHTRKDAKNIQIVNDLNEWHSSDTYYDAILTRACVHHFQNIPQVSLSIRKQMRPGGIWFAYKEFFANRPIELFRNFRAHALCLKHKTYEWPYPASAYVDLIESVGFRLKAIIPSFYENNVLTHSRRGALPAPVGLDISAWTTEIGDLLRRNPGETVERFWREVDYFRRYGHGSRLFTRPEAFVFEKIHVTE